MLYQLPPTQIIIFFYVSDSTAYILFPKTFHAMMEIMIPFMNKCLKKTIKNAFKCIVLLYLRLCLKFSNLKCNVFFYQALITHLLYFLKTFLADLRLRCRSRIKDSLCLLAICSWHFSFFTLLIKRLENSAASSIFLSIFFSSEKYA